MPYNYVAVNNGLKYNVYQPHPLCPPLLQREGGQGNRLLNNLLKQWLSAEPTKGIIVI